MNRDPFDSLRARNPVRPESLPDAPMTVATRITGGRPSLRRGLAIAGATAVAVLAVGSAWLLWSRGGVSETAVEVTTTTLSGTSTTSGSAALYEAPVVVVYFLDADNSTLVPVARDLNVLDARLPADLGPLTLDLLLWGPGAWDAAPLPDPVAAAEAGLTTAIPTGTELLALTVAEGIATVDLSAEFAEAPPEALAQMVFTLTRVEGVTGVRFLIEGEPHWVMNETLALAPTDPLPTAATVMDPVTRLAFAGFVPLVMIESPVLGETLSLPAAVTGLTGQTGADVLLQLIAEDGTLLWSGTAQIPCSECPAGTFAAEMPDSVARGVEWATLRAYLSTFDSGPFAEYPVWIVPDVPFAEEPDIPEATTTTLHEVTTTVVLLAGAPPWSATPLAADAVPAVVADTWAAADNRDECAVLFPADPGSLAQSAVLHDRYFGGGWGLAWDLPSGPGRWEPGGDYCPDCG
ncbi:MAG TPA: GerMN domain-containing protein, partial [Acidimicrobiia bacterium]|nr:GerMN domain-containing protein [Acidimicrobiia bacterium]